MRLQGCLGPRSLPSKVIVFYLQNKQMAERVGFEPTRRFNTAYAISSRAPSANSDTSPRNAARVYQISAVTGLGGSVVPPYRRRYSLRHDMEKREPERGADCLVGAGRGVPDR